MEIADKTDFVDTLDLESPIKPNIQNSVKSEIIDYLRNRGLI